MINESEEIYEASQFIQG